MFRDFTKTSRECGRGGGAIRVRHNSQTINAAAILLTLALGVFAAGCATKGAKVVEGVDFSAGVDFPAAEGAAELSFVNYLSGFRFTADRNYGLCCEFESTNRFSFAFEREREAVQGEVPPVLYERAATDRARTQDGIRQASSAGGGAAGLRQGWLRML